MFDNDKIMKIIMFDNDKIMNSPATIPIYIHTKMHIYMHKTQQLFTVASAFYLESTSDGSL